MLKGKRRRTLTNAQRLSSIISRWGASDSRSCRDHSEQTLEDNNRSGTFTVDAGGVDVGAVEEEPVAQSLRELPFLRSSSSLNPDVFAVCQHQHAWGRVRGAALGFPTTMIHGRRLALLAPIASERLINQKKRGTARTAPSQPGRGDGSI